MGTLTVTEFMTLDGVAQAPGGPEEDLAGAFAFGGWQAPLLDQESGAALFDDAQRMDALLLGRKTYEIFADYWPHASEEIPFTNLLNGVPKYVATRSLAEPLSWSGSSVLHGDLVDAVTEIKGRHREVQVIGSLDLVQSLLAADLVDQLNLWVYPVVLGAGKRVFEPGVVPTALTLTKSVTYPAGTVNLVFSPHGRPSFGDMTAQ
jgi:dihydrofolate reductase